MDKKAIYFELSGKTAFFKKPDVNSYAYFTYNNVHKIVLFGLLGAIIGLKGHQGKEKEAEYPEFYEKLKGLKVSIIPVTPKGVFQKKIQVFNNSIGYASQEQGGNLIVREQWIENPKWFIYLLNDGGVQEDIYQKLADSLLNYQTVYLPYLGKNDHPALIENCREVSLAKNEYDYFDSIFLKEKVELDPYETFDGKTISLFQEVSPYALQSYYNFYQYAEMVFTNRVVLNMDTIADSYAHNNYSLFFY